MKETEFLEESSNYHKLRLLLIVILIIITLAGALFSAMTLFKDTLSTLGYLKAITTTFSPLNPTALFILSITGGLFFFPVPLEALFLKALIEGSPPLLSLLMIFAGLLPSQAINYLIGRKLSSPILNLISKKKVYKTKRWINKYGMYAIFIFHALPSLPSPVASFAVGITRYNITRLYIALILGNLVKYGAIVGIAYLF